MSPNSDVIIKQAEGALESAKPHICGIPIEALEWGFQQSGLEKFRAKQVWQSIYKKGVHAFDDFKSLSKEQREQLSERFEIKRPEVLREQKSEDGTIKWLIGFADGNKAEMVYIPEKERGTLCVSSQVGCTLTCKFCHTGTQRLVRNLEAHEIVGEFLLARDRLNDWGAKQMKLTNIVMMGMGEPLYNFDNVKTALNIIQDENGIGFSKRRITLSTSGVVPMIKKCGDEIGVNLAVSLHAVTDEVRNAIVPLNKKYPIKDLLDACRSYPSTSNWRRITFEYVMLKGVNDSDEDAKKLIKLVKDIPAKINLIPFNAWPGAPYECSSGNRMHAFAEILKRGGLDAPLRTPRGRDILAACGQLKSDSEKKKKSELHDHEAGVAP